MVDEVVVFSPVCHFLECQLPFGRPAMFSVQPVLRTRHDNDR